MVRAKKKRQKTMHNKYPKNIIVDTGFWIAYFDPKNKYYANANEWAEIIFNYSILCSFPALYEFLNTRFSRREKSINEFDILLKKGILNLIYDDMYREDILYDFVERNRYFSRFSLVDIIINRMIDDINLKVDYLFTYNAKDFITACNERNIEILSA